MILLDLNFAWFSLNFLLSIPFKAEFGFDCFIYGDKINPLVHIKFSLGTVVGRWVNLSKAGIYSVTNFLQFPLFFSFNSSQDIIATSWP